MNIQAGSSKMLYHMVRDEPVKKLRLFMKYPFNTRLKHISYEEIGEHNVLNSFKQASCMYLLKHFLGRPKFGSHTKKMIFSFFR